MEQTISTSTPSAPTSSRSHFFRDWLMYVKAGAIGLLTFALCYAYTVWLKIPGELNKSAADTSILLMGMSMLITPLCYYWNVFDRAIIYRKYLGLIGFAFSVAHWLLSWSAFTSLLNATTWQEGKMWPALMGLLGFLIFLIMAMISNSFSARRLGVITWKRILRTGYIAIGFIWLHVLLLKGARWITWYQGGMKTLPSLSLMVAVFMVIVMVMRVALEISLRRKKAAAKATVQVQ